MDPVRVFNTFEAGMWAVFGVLTALFGGRVRGMTGQLRALLAVAFVAFGSSDIIELSTGAWWRPPGLLAYKAVGLLTILGCGLALWRNRRSVVAVDLPETTETESCAERMSE